MRKTLVSVCLLAAMSLAVALPAGRAEAAVAWITGNVTTLMQPNGAYASGNTVVQLNVAMGGSCSELHIPATAANRDQMLRILLSAQLAGRAVGIRRDDATCEISAVRLVTP